MSKYNEPEVIRLVAFPVDNGGEPRVEIKFSYDVKAVTLALRGRYKSVRMSVEEAKRLSRTLYRYGMALERAQLSRIEVIQDEDSG